MMSARGWIDPPSIPCQFTLDIGAQLGGLKQRRILGCEICGASSHFRDSETDIFVRSKHHPEQYYLAQAISAIVQAPPAYPIVPVT
jgi:hypothetical protein